MKKLLLILLCVPFIFSCGIINHGHTENIKIEQTNPRLTAVDVLSAYKSKNLETLASLSTEFNAKLLKQIINEGKKHPRYNSLFVGWRWEAVSNWNGMIGACENDSEYGRSRIEFARGETEVIVVTLYWIDGKWRFEDIHSYPIKSFNQK